MTAILLGPVTGSTSGPSGRNVSPDAPRTFLMANLLGSDAPEVEIWGNPRRIETETLGEAVWFDGVDDALFIDSRPLAGLSDFTVEILLRPDAGGSLEPRFLHIGEVNGGRMMLEARLTEEGEWALDGYLRAGPNYLVLLDRTLSHPVGRWAHAALVVEDGMAKTYVNGRLELRGDLDFHPIDGGAMSIGVRMNQKYWFKGAIHSIRITPSALEPDSFQMGIE